jgi:hypothetical protein
MRWNLKYGNYCKNLRKSNKIIKKEFQQMYGCLKRTAFFVMFCLHEKDIMLSLRVPIYRDEAILKKMCYTFSECVKTVRANNYLPLQLDSRFHGNDRKNRQSPVIASSDLSGRSNLKKNVLHLLRVCEDRRGK